MTRMTELPPARAGLTEALRVAYRAPANDVPNGWQQLLDQLR